MERFHIHRPNNKHLEIKVIESYTPISYYLDSPQTVYPDRILNSQFVIGDKSIHNAARMQVVQEMAANTQQGRRIRRKMKSQLRSYKKAIRTGMYRKKQVFTLPESGQTVQYYTEDLSHMKLGFKPAYLRGIQRRLDIITARLYQMNPKLITPHEIDNLPTSTYERIEFFRNKGLIKKDNRVVEAYYWFLREYHLVQQLYKDQPVRSTEVSAPFDANEFSRYSNIIKEFIGMEHI